MVISHQDYLHKFRVTGYGANAILSWISVWAIRVGYDELIPNARIHKSPLRIRSLEHGWSCQFPDLLFSHV